MDRRCTAISLGTLALSSFACARPPSDDATVATAEELDIASPRPAPLVVSSPPLAAARPVAFVTTGNGIGYHGGPVMSSTAAIYLIWYGNWRI